MRCLVTGASGHLGSFVTRELLKQGFNVTVMVRPESDLWRLQDILDQVSIIRWDLSNLKEVQSSLDELRAEAVFHLAWEGVTSAFKNDPLQLSVNLTGSLSLFEIVRDAGCKLWLGVGSQAEYGPHERVLTEHTPVNPETAYGVAKLEVGLKTEELCALSGIRYLWFRLLATYGPKDDERHLIPTVIRQLLRRERPSLTAGEQLWDYLYIEDAADALVKAAMTENASGVFNLGSGESRSVRSLIERIRDLIDPSLPLGFGDLPYPPDQIMRLETGVDRLRRITEWTPQVSMDEGLRQTVDWYRLSED